MEVSSQRSRKKQRKVTKISSTGHFDLMELKIVCEISERAAYVLLKKQRLGLFPCPEDSLPRTIFWYYSWPIRAILFCTIPNPKTQRKFYIVTFMICVAWIGVVTYLIFFMLIVICKLNNKIVFDGTLNEEQHFQVIRSAYLNR